ncbi:type IV secretory system conjugative DNA transfer family protein [Tundrisphaera sp. TA3]|uniref:type IV secretory system conjugative DNA transfer family protein n=1 Tax=Tundrisphaera sp. TA3 TaxID=3435775 RepID=UPI003EB93162
MFNPLRIFAAKRRSQYLTGVEFAGESWDWKRLAQGVIAFGGIGSGKSFSTEALIEACIRAGCPLLSTAVKPDEYERYEKICKRIGAMERLVRICPGSPHQINLLEELTKEPHGSVAHAANFILNLSDIAKRASPGGGANESFWRNMEESAAMKAITLCRMSLKNPRIPDVWEVIKTGPMDAAHARKPEFTSKADRYRKSGKPIRRNLCAELLLHAERIHTPDQADDLASIGSFFLNELPAVDKIRGSVVAALGGVLDRFCVEPWKSALSPKATTLTPEIIEKNRLVCVLDYPIMTYHTPARLFQAAWLMLTQMHLMRRPASTVDVPFILARDEAAWTLSPEWDSAAHNVLRSQKAVSISIVQCLNTLEAALGGGQKAHHEAMAFASNHMAKLYFSSNSADTSKWASSLIGQHKELSFSGGGGGRRCQPSGDPWDDFLGVSSDTHWSTSWQPLVRPEAFAQLPVGVGILLRDGVHRVVDFRK